MALILSIDNEKSSIKNTSAQLDRLGHTIISATTGEKGLDLARTGNPDLILLDINMPDLDGFEILESLKTHDITKVIPIIMQCKTAKKEDVLIAMKYDIIDYLVKGLDVNTFRRKIDAALDHSRFQRERLEASRVEHINISYQTGKTIVSIRTRLKDKNVMDEAREKLNDSFLDIARYDLCVIDLRYLPEMDEKEIPKLKEFIDLIPDLNLYIVAGRHYGTLMTEVEFEGRIKIFISFGDMEIFFFSEGEKIMDEELTGRGIVQQPEIRTDAVKEDISDEIKKPEEKSKKFSDLKILDILKEAKSGIRVADLCKKYGMSESTFYKWKNKYGVNENDNLDKLKMLEEENNRLKEILTEQALEIHSLKGLLEKE